MKKILVATMVAVMGLALASDVMAGANPMAQLAIHAQPNNAKRNCGTTSIASCGAIVQSSPISGTGYYDLLVVLYDFEEVTGVEYGLQWGSMYFSSFIPCSDLYVFVSTGPQSADVSQVFTSCTDGGGIGGAGRVLGWCNVYSTSADALRFSVTSFPADPSIVDCLFQQDPIHTMHPGFIGGGVPGPGDLGPCEVGPTATENTTWGQLKDLYR
jgi:hypothetical protein